VSRPLARPDETVDGALGGTVRVIQPARGYRFSVDAVFLARFAAEEPCGRALDLGCGCGVVALCLLALGGARCVVGLDIQPEMVDRARRSAVLNGWEARARFLEGDLREAGRAVLAGERFPLVVANPPFQPAGRGRVSPDAAVALARHEVACTLEDVVAAARRMLARGGALCVVYPAPRLPQLLASCRQHGLAPEVLWPVHPRAGDPASRFLLRARQGGKGDLEIRFPLIVHEPGRRYSRQAERLLGPPPGS